MEKKLCVKKEPRWLSVYAALTLAVLMFHMVRFVNEPLWVNVYCVYYIWLIPVFIAFTFYFRRPFGSPEEKLLLLYWAWVFISRLLNGDFFLTKDGDMVLNIGLACTLFPVCLCMKREERQRFLDILSMVVAGFYTLVSLVCLYALLYHKELFNPFTGGNLCSFYYGYRLSVFGKNPNECVLWFFLGFFLLVYQFFRRKNPALRILIVISAALNYLALMATFSRNGMMAFSVCFSLLIAMVAQRVLPVRRQGAKVFLSILVVALLLPATYLSFNASGKMMSSVCNHLLSQEARQEADEPEGEAPAQAAESVDTPAVSYVDKRGMADTGRIGLYKSIVPTIQQEPIRLLRGSLTENVMAVVNQYFVNPTTQFHNTFLQVFALTGLLGLGLVLAFTVIISIRIVRLFFSEAPLAVKSLSLILVGSFCYNLLETCQFVVSDVRSFLFYIIAGAVVSYSLEMRQA